MGLIKYCTVYKAAIADDWEAARLIFEEERNVFLAFTYFNENNPYTPLHIAVATNCSHRFVQELVEWIMRVGDVQMLRFRDTAGHSALHYAAIVGNTQDARLLIDADPELAQMSSIKGWTALTLAAACRRKEAVNYLLQVTKDVINEEGTSPYRGELGADLLLYTIHSDFYGMHSSCIILSSFQPILYTFFSDVCFFFQINMEFNSSTSLVPFFRSIN